MLIASRAFYTSIVFAALAVLSVPLFAHATNNTPLGYVTVVVQNASGNASYTTVTVNGIGVSLSGYESNVNTLSYSTNSSNDSRVVTMNAGTYSVTVPSNGYTYSGSCSGYLSQGESKTCVITATSYNNNTGNGYYDTNGVWHSYDTDCYNGTYYNTCGGNCYSNSSYNNCNNYQSGNARVNVMVNVVNAYGGTRTASDFVITVTGSAINSRTFNGSNSQIQIALASGSYAIDAQSIGNYTVARSADCSGTIGSNETRSCTITLYDRNTNYYNPNYNYNYGANTLSCTASAQTVGVGQTASFSAAGGAGPYTWTTSERSYYAVGSQLNVVLTQPGYQTVSVSNGYQTATCAVNVVSKGVVLGSSTVIPGLPNTGYAPTNLGLILALLGAFVAFPVALYMAYQYAKRTSVFA